jgi:flagellar biogenesis protein FliO
MDAQDIFIRFVLLGFLVFLIWWVRDMMSKSNSNKKNRPQVPKYFNGLSPAPTPSRPDIALL